MVSPFSFTVRVELPRDETYRPSAARILARLQGEMAARVRRREPDGFDFERDALGDGRSVPSDLAPPPRAPRQAIDYISGGQLRVRPTDRGFLVTLTATFGRSVIVGFIIFPLAAVLAAEGKGWQIALAIGAAVGLVDFVAGYWFARRHLARWIVEVTGRRALPIDAVPISSGELVDAGELATRRIGEAFRYRRRPPESNPRRRFFWRGRET